MTSLDPQALRYGLHLENDYLMLMVGHDHIPTAQEFLCLQELSAEPTMNLTSLGPEPQAGLNV